MCETPVEKRRGKTKVIVIVEILCDIPLFCIYGEEDGDCSQGTKYLSTTLYKDQKVLYIRLQPHAKEYNFLHNQNKFSQFTE